MVQAQSDTSFEIHQYGPDCCTCILVRKLAVLALWTLWTSLLTYPAQVTSSICLFYSIDPLIISYFCRMFHFNSMTIF